MARPRGTFGPCGKALLEAAEAAPGTVDDLARRALVSMRTARYTASRLVSAGALVVVQPGRPAVLALPAEDASAASARLHDAIAAWCCGR